MNASKATCVLVFYNPKTQHRELCVQVTEFLQAKLFEVVLIDVSQEGQLKMDGCVYQFGVVLGGDGTVLRASALVQSLDIPLFSIHAGTLGFLAEHGEEQWQANLEAFLRGELPIVCHAMLMVAVYEQDVEHARWYAVNEIAMVMAQRKLLNFTFQIGQQAVVPLRAEGFMVSTPIGSTGHALALGSPIIAPNAKVLLVNAIAPFDLSARALVIDEQETIEVCVDEPAELHIVVDGQIKQLEVSDALRLTIKQSSQRVLWVQRAFGEGQTFYDVLRNKLGWFTLYAGAK